MKGIIKYLALMASMLMVFGGCSDDFKDNKKEQGSSACAQDYFNSQVSTTLNACVSCHSSSGQASGTNLKFKEPVADQKSANFKILKSYIEKTDKLVVDKGSNAIKHTGGEQLAGSAKTVMSTFVEYVKGRKACVSEADVGSIKASAISLSSVETTLRNASIKLSGRAPSTEDYKNAGSIDSIDASLDKYMETDVFYDWLTRSMNDFLLTDKYFMRNQIDGFLNGDDFNNRFWWDNLPNEGFLRQQADYALSREAVNMITHVVKNNKPFSEILTADYVLVNPYSALTYNIDKDGFTFDINDANLSEDELESKYPRDNFIEAQAVMSDGTIIPHAGILTTMAFMRRYPSTNTNLDRARSYRTQLYFFDTDILALANRPVKAADVIGNSSTWTNPNCTVCHNVMEPIASAYSNWDNEGRYRPGWRLKLAAFSREPGLSLDKKVPTSYDKNMLQWLAKEMVKDDRFAMASVKLFVKAILGRDALKDPAKDDLHYVDAKQAYNYENAILTKIKNKFVASNMNAKVIIKEIIKSPLFRANGLSVNNAVLSDNLGSAKLLSPEELDEKVKSIMGVYWDTYGGAYAYYRYDDENNNDKNRHRLLGNTYRKLYGGIDSDAITTRVTELNGIMANIQLKLALDMSCYPTTLDFYKPLKDRKLFPFVTASEEPITEGAILDIKKNIQHLHKFILGEDLAITDPEIEATYKLFLDTYNEGQTALINGDVKVDLGSCGVYNIPDNYPNENERLPDYKIVSRDANYVIRSWSAVIVYLLSDYKFFYENSAQ